MWQIVKNWISTSKVQIQYKFYRQLLGNIFQVFVSSLFQF